MDRKALFRLQVDKGISNALLNTVQGNSQCQEASEVLKNILIIFVTARLESIEEITSLIRSTQLLLAHVN